MPTRTTVRSPAANPAASAVATPAGGTGWRSWVRARATRDGMVPTGPRQAGGPPSYDSRTSWVSTRASRRSSGSPRTRSRVQTGPAGSGTGSGTGSRPSSRRRRCTVRMWSAHTCRAMASNQVRAVERPANSSSPRNARRYVSWVRSSALPGSTRDATKRHTSPWVARTNPVASRTGSGTPSTRAKATGNFFPGTGRLPGRDVRGRTGGAVGRARRRAAGAGRRRARSACGGLRGLRDLARRGPGADRTGCPTAGPDRPDHGGGPGGSARRGGNRPAPGRRRGVRAPAGAADRRRAGRPGPARAGGTDPGRAVPEHRARSAYRPGDGLVRRRRGGGLPRGGVPAGPGPGVRAGGPCPGRPARHHLPDRPGPGRDDDRARVRAPGRGRPGRSAVGARTPYPRPAAPAPRGGHPMSRVRLLAALVLGVLGVLALPAGPASAHVALVRTSPVQGTVLQQAPSEVVVTFSEPVGLVRDKIQVIGPDGKRIDKGDPTVSGDDLRVPVRTDVPRGTYLVSYRVISADSHPVGAGFTYSLGAPSTTPPRPGDSTAGRTDRAVAMLLSAARWLGYVGLILLAGPALILLALWPNRLS